MCYPSPTPSPLFRASSLDGSIVSDQWLRWSHCLGTATGSTHYFGLFHAQRAPANNSLFGNLYTHPTAPPPRHIASVIRDGPNNSDPPSRHKQCSSLNSLLRYLLPNFHTTPVQPIISRAQTSVRHTQPSSSGSTHKSLGTSSTNIQLLPVGCLSTPSFNALHSSMPCSHVTRRKSTYRSLDTGGALVRANPNCPFIPRLHSQTSAWYTCYINLLHPSIRHYSAQQHGRSSASTPRVRHRISTA